MVNLHNASLHNNIQPKANDPCIQHGLANIRCSKIQLLIMLLPITGDQSYINLMDNY